jgi:hypothetical protein
VVVPKPGLAVPGTFGVPTCAEAAFDDRASDAIPDGLRAAAPLFGDAVLRKSCETREGDNPGRGHIEGRR